jgi:hypothetical protein
MCDMKELVDNIKKVEKDLSVPRLESLSSILNTVLDELSILETNLPQTLSKLPSPTNVSFMKGSLAYINRLKKIQDQADGVGAIVRELMEDVNHLRTQDL